MQNEQGEGGQTIGEIRIMYPKRVWILKTMNVSDETFKVASARAFKDMVFMSCNSLLAEGEKIS